METTITSPTEAVLRLDPPSTLMHCTRRAPELSATSRLDSTWIIYPLLDLHRRVVMRLGHDGDLWRQLADRLAVALEQQPRLASC